MNQSLALACIACLLLVGSCKEEVTTLEQAVFQLKNSSETGIAFSNDLKEDAQYNIVEYLYYYNGGGVAIGDVNGDGLEDIFFTSNQNPDRLYLNKGNLSFEDISEKAGIRDNDAWSTGVTIEDINNDGFLDIYVCKVSMFEPDSNYHNLLYINNGEGQFTEMSKDFGLDFSGYSTQSCFLDYDKDGDLDMYLLNHAVHSVRSYGNTEKRKLKDPVSGDLFFENRLREEGKFVDVTKKAGIYNSPLGYGLAVVAGDVNNDGWTDIYVGNDFHENDYMYINQGNKSFKEAISGTFPYTSQFSMGVDMADMNNDGWEDIFTTDMMPYDTEVALTSGGEDTDQIKRIKEDLGFEYQNARNHFQINEQDGSFRDIAFMTETYATDWSWSVLLQDFDNDLYNDIFITNGIVKRPNDLDYINYLNSNTDLKNFTQFTAQMPSQPLSNILFLHKEGLKYSGLRESFVGPPAFSNGAAYGDLDKDGDLDLVVNNINQTAFLLENMTSASTHYIAVDLKIPNKSLSAKGSLVTVYSGDQIIMKEYQTTRGYLSSSTHSLHFGLADLPKIDSLVVIWPDQYRQTLTDVAINQHMSVYKEEEEKLVLHRSDRVHSIDKENSLVLPFKHEENKYFDEDIEKLIPERLSYEGPALLCEDLNGDGIKDIFMGGARNQKAILLIGTPQGGFNLKFTSAFESDAKYEDVDATTIDFDADGDKDIYVVSGGNDNKELDKILEDRIYLNNGGANFSRIPISLPHTNGSCVSTADFNKDGYEDIFVGARSIPGAYGLSPYSFVLKNLNGQGVDIAYKERYGMIQDGEWIDLDSNGYPDLVMCGDWMNIIVYYNNNGELENKTRNFGLAGIQGFWNTLAFTDVNKDGHLDMLAGNAGTNSKWKASPQSPIKLYVGDFDENGNPDPIIFFPYFDRYMPFPSLNKLVAQAPIFKKNFVSYDSYKDVQDIGDLMNNPEEFIVESKVVTELRSMIFIREGEKFVGYPLGDNEQLSAINDFEVTSDGKIYYVGNNNEYVAELGKSSANSGRVLSDFDEANKAFSKSEKLPLPMAISGKKIARYSEGQMIVATNKGYPYIIRQ